MILGDTTYRRQFQLIRPLCFGVPSTKRRLFPIKISKSFGGQGLICRLLIPQSRNTQLGSGPWFGRAKVIVNGYLIKPLL